MSEVDNSPASRVSSSIFLLAPRVLLVKTRLALRVTQGLIATAVYACKLHRRLRWEEE